MKQHFRSGVQYEQRPYKPAAEVQKAKVDPPAPEAPTEEQDVAAPHKISHLHASDAHRRSAQLHNPRNINHLSAPSFSETDAGRWPGMTASADSPIQIYLHWHTGQSSAHKTAPQYVHQMYWTERLRQCVESIVPGLHTYPRKGGISYATLFDEFDL